MSHAILTIFAISLPVNGILFISRNEIANSKTTLLSTGGPLSIVSARFWKKMRLRFVRIRQLSARLLRGALHYILVTFKFSQYNHDTLTKCIANLFKDQI